MNGRAIPDGDLDDRLTSATELAVRGLAFASRALGLLPDAAPPLSAFVSVGPTLHDENVVTGTVTFCVERADEPPYLRNLDDFAKAIAQLRSVRSDSWASPRTDRVARRGDRRDCRAQPARRNAPATAPA